MLIKLFEEQVEKFAAKDAVVTDRLRLSYRDLNERANGVGNALRRVDAGPVEEEKSPFVSLLFPHSADMIIAVLGTLKGGKAYMPMDVTYPEARLAYMLENSESRLILTNSEYLPLAQKLASGFEPPLEIIDIDSLDKSLPQENPKREADGDKLAYILYTSGSTGKPKGVVQDHRNVWYYVRNWIRDFSITPSDRMTLFSSFSHDGAGQDMFGALLSGATLYPFNILNRPNIADLSNWLINEKITIYHSVHTLFRYFVNTLRDEDIGRFTLLRYILLGGEAIRDYDIQVFQRYFPHSTLVNVYGQTESSVSTTWHIKPNDTVQQMFIGSPLDQTQILILDDNDEVVEDLGVGEIVVNSETIALGYWKNQEATEKVFSHDPELGKLYFTGDLGRLMADGAIEFLGRKDSQVKIRGFRVEVGEIETRLLNHPAIKEAVVVPKEDRQNIIQLCAYIVTHQQAPFTVSDMREYLSGELPEYMIPSFLVRLEQLPTTPSGKIDRKRLPEPEHLRPELGVSYLEPKTSLEAQLADIWKDVLGLDKVGVKDNFFDLGGNSFNILKIMRRLYEVFHKDVPVVSLFRYPTIRTFAQYFQQEIEEKRGDSIRAALSPVERVRRRKAELGEARSLSGSIDGSIAGSIAVIGMAGRFPGARNIDEFWDNLIHGVESVSFFSTAELEQGGVAGDMLADPNYVSAYGVLTGIEYFDAGFFNYSPREAQMMDPQLRLLHECSWEALENAGYNPENYNGLIGLYAGNAPNQYWLGLTYINQTNNLDTLFLNSNYSTKVSYKLNLTGPSVIVQTACSTSMVAIHFACRGLIDGECDMALAGGVSVTLPDRQGHLYQEGMLLSRDGHCRTFDARAGGTIFGNGAGMVVLKRLEDAVAHQDVIDAVIKGTAINNDGNRKVGLTAPSVEGQAEVIAIAQEMAGVAPESVTYIETHGTGTLLGDPVEIEALNLVFAAGKKRTCAIGSAKTNIGHINAAAGVAGVIKTVLALKYKIIPPSLHYEIPNPQIDFENCPFFVNTGLLEWKGNGNGQPRRAGVNSFGIGGTNAHVVLEESPVEVSINEPPAREYGLFLLSAKTQTALEKTTKHVVKYVKEVPGINLADAAYTLQMGRKSFKYRRMAVCARADELENLESAPVLAASEDDRMVIFMFSGQGTQYVNMGLGLHRTEPVFRAEMDRCFAILKPLLGTDIKEILYPSSPLNRSPESHTSDSSAADNQEKLNQTEIVQPLLFVFEYALARLLMEWGIKPHAMIGYSFGEYITACLSGVFSLEDALKMVVTRGELMRQAPAGAMLSVPLPEAEIKPILAGYPDISLCIVNDPSSIVGGTPEAIEAFNEEMKKRRLLCGRVNIAHAVHSPMMFPIRREFEEHVSQLPLNPPRIPYISNVSGDWISDQDAVDPTYWGKHLCATARFADGIKKLSGQDGAVFIEIGPGRVLGNLVRQHADNNPNQMVLNLVRHQEENVPDHYYLLKRLGQLWLYGVSPDWPRFYGPDKRRRVHLPTYPFEGKRFWLEGNPMDIGKRQVTPVPLPGKKPNIEDWFYVPTWKSSPIPEPGSDVGGEKSDWLLFMDACNIGTQLKERLEKDGHRVVVARPADTFSKAGDNEYTINPGEEDDYVTLLAECREAGRTPRRILHLWNLTGPADIPQGALTGEYDREKEQELGFYCLLHLAQAIGKLDFNETIEITVLTDRMQGVTGADIAYPGKATILGPVQVIPREYPNINCRSIDIEIPSPGTPEENQLIEHLFKEILTESSESVTALRDNQRWVRTFEPKPLSKPGTPGTENPRLKQGGVYLVTGGLGGIGLEVSRWLAETVKARLILTGRGALPPKEQWADWLSTDDSDGNIADIAGKIRKVRELEKAGAEVLVFSADAANKEQMQEMIVKAESAFGKINGVIHAAGLPDGTIIQRRTRDMSQRVLSPKVTGAWVLDDLLKSNELDFFILCSSTVAITALGGQVAYCAANVFLDHFARYRSARDHSFTVSINWDAWKQVGMAAKAVKDRSRQKEPDRPRHPLFDRYEKIEPGHGVFTSFLDIKKDWVLEEHRILDKATLPGTAYLEMARAALEIHTRNGNLELSDTFFLSPLTAAEGEQKEVRTILKKNRQEYTFSIISRSRSGQDSWVEHARGTARYMDEQEAEPQTHDITQFIDTYAGKEIDAQSPGHSQTRGAMTFGPRWDNLRHTMFPEAGETGEKQGYALLELPETFSDDTHVYRLHPALLDVATTFLRPMISREGAYMPFFYKRLRVKAGLPARIACYARSLDRDDGSQKETLKFAVKIMDTRGVELVDIDEFTLKRVNVEAARARQILDPGAPVETGGRPYTFFLPPDAGKNQEPDQSPTGTQPDPLKDAILPEEGVDAFTRILAGQGLHQVLVSTTDLDNRLRQIRILTEEFHQRRFQDEGPGLPRHARPELSSAYLAPKTETERILAEIWQDILGVEKVGILDDFFELGGDSLKAVTLVARIRKELGRDIPVFTLFSYQTIRTFTQFLETEEKNKQLGDSESNQSELLDKSSQKMKDSVQRLRHKMREK